MGMNTHTTIGSWLTYLIYAGLFILPFTPLVVASSLFFPFITGKAFLFRIIVEIIFGLWLVLATLESRFRPRISYIAWAFGIFLVVMTVADMTGANPARSFWSNFERMEGLITLIHLALYFIVLSSTLVSEKAWAWFLNTSIVASVFVAFNGITQYSDALAKGQAIRLDATLGNAAYLAIYTLCHIVIALLYIYRTLKKKTEYSYTIVGIYAATIALNGFILFQTATRGTLIGMLAAAIVAGAIYAYKAQSLALRRFGLIVFLVPIIFIGLFIAFKNQPFLKDSPVFSRFTSISLEETTTKSRFMIWDMAWQGFKERPVLGWGQENFNLIFNKYFNPGMYGQEQWFDRAHNVFFDWLTAGGILGLLAYLGLFGVSLYVLWKSNHFDLAEKTIITSFFVGYFVHNIFVFDNLVSYLLFFTILAYIHNKEGKILLEKDTTLHESALLIGIGSAVVTSLTIFIVNVPAYNANTNLLKAMSVFCQTSTGQQAYCFGKPETNLQLFKNALNEDSFAKQEIRERLLDVAAQLNRPDVDAATRNNLLTLASSEIEKQIKDNPADARPLSLYAGFLVRTGNPQLGITYFEQALQSSPKKQAIMYSLIDTYIALKAYDKAFVVAQQAYELDPSFDDAKLAYAVSALYTGNDALIKEIYPLGLPNDPRIGNVFYTIKRYQDAIDVYEKAIAAHPEQINLRASLSAAYFEAGNIGKAVAVLEEVKKQSPQYAASVDSLIKQLKAGKNPFAQN